MKAKFLTALCLLVPMITNSADKEWRFRVYLDNKEIGYHSFALEDQGDERRIDIEANFEYKLLFLSLFEYSHQNTEVWSGDCLQAIAAKTIANGESYELRGNRSDGSFRIAVPRAEAQLPHCVMTFAYWNPNFLKQERLLDPQTGELLDVEVSEPSPDQLLVNGAAFDAWRYRLEADGLGISLWYSEDDEWLALEADAVGGRKLRYELM